MADERRIRFWVSFAWATLTTITGACRSAPPPLRESSDTKTTEHGSDAVVPTSVVPQDLRVRISRYSPPPHPVYELSVSASGQVEFDGRENVARLGCTEWRVSDEALQAILSEIDTSLFWSLASDRQPRISRFPVASLTVVCRGRERTIRFCWVGPDLLGRTESPEDNTFSLGKAQALTALARKIQTIVDCQDFIRPKR